MNCKARQHSDQMIWGRCGLEWDVNDPDPPACLTAQELGNRTIEQIREGLSDGEAVERARRK